MNRRRDEQGEWHVAHDLASRHPERHRRNHPCQSSRKSVVQPDWEAVRRAKRCEGHSTHHDDGGNPECRGARWCMLSVSHGKLQHAKEEYKRNSNEDWEMPRCGQLSLLEPSSSPPNQEMGCSPHSTVHPPSLQFSPSIASAAPCMVLFHHKTSVNRKCCDPDSDAPHRMQTHRRPSGPMGARTMYCRRWTR